MNKNTIIDSKHFLNEMRTKQKNKLDRELSIVRKAIEEAYKDPNHLSNEIVLNISSLDQITLSIIADLGYEVKNRRTGINEISLVLIAREGVEEFDY